MSQTPLLSIVAAVYNGEKFLAQFFECIEQQQLDSYELILVNDGSTDNSLAVIAEWRDRLQNVQVLEQENQGVSVARNTGLAAASGKYLAFPDIDDKLYPGMYRTLLEMAEKAHLSHGDVFQRSNAFARIHCNNPVYHEKGITVGQNGHDGLDIKRQLMRQLQVLFHGSYLGCSVDES